MKPLKINGKRKLAEKRMRTYVLDFKLNSKINH